MISSNSRSLILPPNWLGDGVMALPAINKWLLQNHSVSAQCDVLCKPRVAEFWAVHPKINQVYTIPESYSEIPKLWRALKANNYSQALVFPRTLRAALWAKFLVSNKQIGFNSGIGRFFHNQKINDAARDQEHQILTYLRLVQADKLPTLEQVSFFDGQTIENLKLQASKFTGSDPYFCLIPGAARGPAKRWPLASYASLALELSKSFPQNKILLLGTANEAELAAEIMKRANNTAIISLAGKTNMSEFMGVLAAANLVVCNDSGGMHLSVAVNAPLIALFGETDPRVTGPVGNFSYVLQKSERRSRVVAADSPSAIAALQRISVADVLTLVHSLHAASNLEQSRSVQFH